MREKRICESFPGGQTTYPYFVPDEGEEAAAARMNAFYAALREEMENYGKTLGSQRLCGDYTSREDKEGGRILTYTLRLRIRGKTAAMKTLRHHWHSGWLCPPSRKDSRAERKASSRKRKGFLLNRR